MSQYEQQAEKFLSDTGTTFECKFLRNGKYFDNDKDVRDIYEITLKRGSRCFIFEFGQSLAKSGKYIVKDHNPKLTKTFFDKRLAADYAERIGSRFNVRDNPNFEAPTAYDVLACLTKYNPGTLQDFCNEFGYDEDSKKAEKTYNAVLNEWRNVCMLFSDTEIEILQEIQ